MKSSTVPRTPSWARRGGLLLLGAFAGVQCSSDPGGPSQGTRGTPIPIEVGDTVTVDVGGLGTGNLFILQADRDQDLDLFGETSAASARAGVVDSVTHLEVTRLPLVADGAPLLAHRGFPPFPVQAGRIYKIFVNAPAGAKTRLFLYPVPVAPEAGQDSLALGEAYGGESLETLGDVDRFQFQVEAGQSYAVYLQQTGSMIPGLLYGAVHDDTNGVLATQVAGVTTDSPSVTLAANPTGRFVARANGRYELEVGSTAFVLPRGTTRPGSYRVELVHIDARPEGTDSVLPRDSTISSALDFPGDLDRFVFDAAAGDSLSLGAPGTRWSPLLAL